MPGKMSKRGRYEKPVQQLIEALESGNSQSIKAAYGYLIGVAKQFPTVDQLASIADFWFTQIDSQPWIVEIIEDYYKGNGKFSVQEVEEPKKTSNLVLKNRIK